MSPSDGIECAKMVFLQNPREEPPTMDDIATIGLDIAKNVFQLHGVDARGQVVLRKALRRANMIAFFTKLPPCLIGMEAC
ncbi:hypothetical protein FHT28_006918, partial [Rhizobium sp. SG570]|nr:hypothetical protein [Rhizobium sp. SG570]